METLPLIRRNIEPQGLPSDMDGYLASMDKAAARAKELSEYWKKAIADGTLNVTEEYKDHPDYLKHKEADDRVRFCFQEAKIASAKVHLYRRQNLKRFLRLRGGWRAVFGAEPWWDMKGDPNGDTEVGKWPEMSKEETLKIIMRAKGVDLAEATKIYEEKWNEIKGGVGYQGHQTAVDKAESVKKVMAGIDMDCR
ncbi:hypothetical protein VTI74DRAFT_2736 [Chaetomium olivicolor]